MRDFPTAMLTIEMFAAMSSVIILSRSVKEKKMAWHAIAYEIGRIWSLRRLIGLADLAFPSTPAMYSFALGRKGRSRSGYARSLRRAEEVNLQLRATTPCVTPPGATSRSGR